MKYKLPKFYGILLLASMCLNSAFADRGAFDFERWDNILNNIKTKAFSQNINKSVIDETLKNPVFIPKIVKSDKNQSEFTLTLDQYLERTVNHDRISQGRHKKLEYPTLLHRIEHKYSVPSNVILAFWGLESNYGKTKSTHRLTDAFFTLIYEGRREEFFSKQLLALMKIADKNKLSINKIHGSWAGAMGHFQFIPTTLAQYGVDGNNDKSIDVINSVGDAMHSAANYLNKLGWNANEKIVRKVVIPADFDRTMLNGDVKKSVTDWAKLGVTNPDGSPLPETELIAGLVADTKEIAKRDLYQPYRTDETPDADVAPAPVIAAYLAYPNFYRIKKWNNSSWYALAIAELSEKLK